METAWQQNQTGLGRHPLLILAAMLLLTQFVSFAAEYAYLLDLWLDPYGRHTFWDIYFDWSHPFSIIIWGALVTAATLVIALLLHRRRKNLERIRFPLPRPMQVISVFGAIILIYVLDSMVTQFVSLSYVLEDEYPYRPGFYVPTMSNLLVGVLFYSVIIAPITEEYLYRGLGMGCLLERGWSNIAAVALTSACFAIVHTQYYPSGMLMVFLSGVVFGLQRLSSGGLTIPIITHALYNLFATLYDFYNPVAL